jgi:Helix-turn-helix domain
LFEEKAMNANSFYSLEEVMHLLNKSKSTVLREAKSGEIPSILEPGKKKGRLYPRKAIDVLVERQKKRGYSKPPKLIFSYSTISDIWSEVEIGRELYGDNDIVSYETLLEWRDINAEMFMSLKDEGRVVAYSSLMPLDENILLPLLEDKIREQNIPLNSIKPWTDPRLSVYVASVTVKPTGDARLDANRGEILLKHTIQWALTVQRQYDIKNWYGIGATKEGQKIFETLGFKEILSLYNGERKGYKLNNSITPSASLLSKMLEKAEATA